MTFDFRSGDRSRAVALRVILTAGVALRLWQYGTNPSLWLDEAALARNIVERPARELLLPLDYGQVAPIGFLLLQKLITAVFDRSEPALRAVPLVCGLASLFLFTALARRMLTGAAAVYAVLVFASAQPFVYFSSQAKQYSVDIAVSLMAMLLVLRVLEPSRGPRSLLVFAGMLVPIVSTASGLVLFGAASSACLVVLLRRHTDFVRGAVPILAIWMIASAAAGLLAASAVPTEVRLYLDSFWRPGYMPRSISHSVPWLWETLKDVFSSFGSPMFRTNGGLGLRWPALFAATTLLGVVVMWRARRDTAAILAGPLVCVLVASVLRMYPATGRLLAFVVPLLLIGLAAGAQVVWRWFGERLRIGGAAVALVFVALPIAAAVETRPPYSIQPLRPVLEQMAQLHRHGDAVYVDYAAVPAFLFYAPRFGLDRSNYVTGRCAVTDRRDYLRQVDRFRGRSRVWVVATHLSSVERSVTIGYLEEIGRRLESIFVAPEGAPLRLAAYARLYDLSQPDRLSRASAATHPIQEPPLDAETREWGCSGPLAPTATETDPSVRPRGR